jgi:quinol-cytochrome oxidoreductase complex cytochrome b subunit
MNVEVIFVIGGGAVLLLLILGPLAVWIARRARPTVSQGPALTRSGVLVMTVFVVLLVLGAILAQLFAGVERLLFAVCYLLALIVAFTAIARLLEKRGLPIKDAGRQI